MSVGTGSSTAIAVNLMINDKHVRMELDTGAAVSVISAATKKELFPKTPMDKSTLLLHTYTGERLKVHGQMNVRVRYGDQSKTLPLVVVEGNGNLLGQNWLKHIRLDWKKIGAIHVATSVEQLCQKYDSVFQKGPGTITPYKASLSVQDQAKLKFCKARPVPYSIRETVGKQLDLLEEQGVLTRVDHGEWATPLVVVPKKNGKVRLCGDFKVTLNSVMDVDQYPFQSLRIYLLL